MRACVGTLGSGCAALALGDVDSLATALTAYDHPVAEAAERLGAEGLAAAASVPLLGVAGSPGF